jgi:hypothetical protein
MAVMRTLVRDHGLSLVMTVLFVLAISGQALTGWSVYNDDQKEHGGSTVAFPAYLTTGHFGEAVFENWESEFLQMGLFVVLTVVLRQRGSPESKPMEGDDDVDRPGDPNRPGAPLPVRIGGLLGKVYEHSLSIALLTLFAISFALHVVTGAAAYSAQQEAHGEAAVSPIEYLTSSQLWFESFQNWQSEFMSIGALVVLGIFLRQRGSPESKPVDAPHDENEG